ncbi:sensor histidine kinase [Dyadobacter frigoris]|nr:sensor histidine kinase [Dyadobacter frigoris]GLU52592.1 hypothetical protein Dfri01_20530 [Dyadobacter frigoris]
MLSSFQEFDHAAWAATVNVSAQAAVAYINIRFLIPEFFEKRKYMLYGLIAFLVLFAFTKVHLTLVEPNLQTTSWGRELRFPRAFQFTRIYLFLFIILIISTAYKFAADRFQTLSRQSELAKKQLEIELETLKNQINPHFLFNTLNNIYTLAYLKDDNAAPMIMKLSELLRYMLYECQTQKVSLEKEVRFLENIVEMQKLKSETHFNRVSLEVRGIRSEHSIAPLLILGFVENSFKHSDLDVNHDGFIQIDLFVDDSKFICFTCTNTKREVEKMATESGGIGLLNTKKRLELIYGANYNLEITETADQYQVSLKLPAYEN